MGFHRVTPRDEYANTIICILIDHCKCSYEKPQIGILLQYYSMNII